jgi:hypothetical protein
MLYHRIYNCCKFGTTQVRTPGGIEEAKWRNGPVMGNAESNEIVDDNGAVEPEGSVLLKLRGIRDKIGDHVSGIGEELVESYVTISSPAFCTEARTIPTPLFLHRGENVSEDIVACDSTRAGISHFSDQFLTWSSNIPIIQARSAADCCGPGEKAYKGSANRVAQEYYLADVSPIPRVLPRNTLGACKRHQTAEAPSSWWDSTCLQPDHPMQLRRSDRIGGREAGLTRWRALCQDPAGQHQRNLGSQAARNGKQSGHSGLQAAAGPPKKKNVQFNKVTLCRSIPYGVLVLPFCTASSSLERFIGGPRFYQAGPAGLALLNLRTSSLQKCGAIPRRARI